MSRRTNKAAIADEPACWGSGELELIPSALARVFSGISVDGVVPSKRSRRSSLFQPEVIQFTSSSWAETFSSMMSDDPSMTILDKAVAAVEKVYVHSPDRLDVPVVSSPLDRVDHALQLPLEIATWERVFAAGVETDHEVCTLLFGTFREMCDRLGDVRAALDLSVTGSSWLRSNDNGFYGFVCPVEPQTFGEAVELARLRAFRECGWPSSSSQYVAKFADVMGKRRAIGLEKAWSLQQCSEEMGITRERVRQVEQLWLWDGSPRAWGRPSVLEAVYEQLLDLERTVIVLDDENETLPRESIAKVLVRFGYPAEDFEAPWSVFDELELHGIKWATIQRVAYGESEKLGLMSMMELRHHIAEQFPMLVGEMFDDIVNRLVMFNDLAHGYVYLENKKFSWVRSWLHKVLGFYGQLSFEETYKALERFCTVRIPRFVFPPRAVLKDFLERYPAFWIVDGMVGLEKPSSIEIDGVEKWVHDQIVSCTGKVIHKSELWERARRDDVSGGTLNVYTSYHLFFKPCGFGCITLTGHQPSPEAIELARIRARAIRVPTRRGKVSVSDGVMFADYEVGNGFLDTGVMGTTTEMRSMIKNQVFKIMVDDQQFGHASWSGLVLTGFTTAFQVLGVEPGDKVVFAFDVARSEVDVSFPFD